MKIAVIGATGLVGQKIIKLLEERHIDVEALYPVASAKSVGKKIVFNQTEYPVLDIDSALEKEIDVAIFSAGSQISLQYAPLFAEKGVFVIDNSSAWRMHKDKKLIIPEINADTLTEEDLVIANPNCSTIQMLMVLAPLHKKYTIKRVIVSTYQSISGTGMKAIKQLESERKGVDGEKVYPHPIDLNCLPHCDDFVENGYTKEEMKLVNETHKILNDYNIKISATAVRVPVIGGHSESVNVEFEKDIDINEIKGFLANTEGVVVKDDIANNVYPMPIDAKDKDDVFVGRIRQDLSNDKAVNLWIVSDNLRKGAATNAVQIMEYLVRNNFIK